MKTRTYRGLAAALAILLIGCHRSPEQNAADSAATASAPASHATTRDELPRETDEALSDGLQRSVASGPKRAAPATPGASNRGSPESKAAASPVREAEAYSPSPTKARAAMVRGLLQAPPPSAPGMNTPDFDTEAYEAASETGFVRVQDSPLSTFSIDVDTASYSNVRRFLNQGQLPPSGAVRIEELINYFPFAYADPVGDAPFSVTTELSVAPWSPEHRLLHVGLQGKRLANPDLPPKNLVFLLDVSGSMDSPNKLPLLKRSLATLTESLTERDQLAIVVYAGASGLVLPPTPGDQQARILASLDRLGAGGSTNGAEGIELAYAVAEGMLRPGAMTRVVLATDGDFNVGVTSQSELLNLIEAKRKTGVFLSVLGFGMGNYKDSTLELLADKGNGNYAYIDSLSEARKVLVAEGGATLVTLAKDVKLQLEFNPDRVGAYRLIGYENRRLAAQDFNDDAKDAGELGAGHSVTALYELIPPGAVAAVAPVDALKYQRVTPGTPGHSGELCTIKLRHKQPNAEQSRLLERSVADAETPLAKTSSAFRLSAAVAAFGMTLRESPARGAASFALARELAEGARGPDPQGYEREFSSLVASAEALRK